MNSSLDSKLGNAIRPSQTCWVGRGLLLGPPTLARDSIGTVTEFDIRHFEMPKSIKVTVGSLQSVCGSKWQWRMSVHQLFSLPFLMNSLRSISVNHTLRHDFMWQVSKDKLLLGDETGNLMQPRQWKSLKVAKVKIQIPIRRPDLWRTACVPLTLSPGSVSCQGKKGAVSGGSTANCPSQLNTVSVKLWTYIWNDSGFFFFF